MNKIRVLLVDDHAVVRAGYRALLDAVDDIEVVAEADRGEKACELYARLLPDVVVIDLSMPGIGGLEAIRRIIARHHEARILVFSMHADAAYVEKAIQAGASGYLSKSSDPENMLNAIRELNGNGNFYDATVTQYASTRDAGTGSRPFAELTTREFQIFTLLSKGLNANDIAAEISLSPKTVANYATQIKTKLGVKNHSELVHLAMQHDLL